MQAREEQKQTQQQHAEDSCISNTGKKKVMHDVKEIDKNHHIFKYDLHFFLIYSAGTSWCFLSVLILPLLGKMDGGL